MLYLCANIRNYIVFIYSDHLSLSLQISLCVSLSIVPSLYIYIVTLSLLRRLYSMSITIYQHANYKGKAITSDKSLPDLRLHGFNDMASSIKVNKGRFILYEHINYTGKYYTIGPGDYNISAVKLMIGNDIISSIFKVSNSA